MARLTLRKLEFTVPDWIVQLPEQAVAKRIRALRQSLGERVVLLAHHYQRPEIVALADHRGDSLELSRIAAEQRQAKHIIFCGVNFMAESAAILCRPHQRVMHPDFAAGCPLADMASLAQVEQAWQELAEVCDPSLSVMPVTYINSTADIKAFCGRRGGSICTSSNARAVLRWALAHREKVFFFPDQHLGRNTANALGIPAKQQVLWDPRQPLGGNTRTHIREAKVILWKGHCHVHTLFGLEHIEQARRLYPGCRIVVHPECKEEVVKAADANGSTGFIVRYVQEASPGSCIVIGTEINLIARLAREHPDKRIYELARSLCPNMYKINLYNLYWTMSELGKVNVVTVAEDVKKHARAALARMLKIV
jgi:quinolinate synthase